MPQFLAGIVTGVILTEIGVVSLEFIFGVFHSIADFIRTLWSG